MVKTRSRPAATSATFSRVFASSVMVKPRAASSPRVSIDADAGASPASPTMTPRGSIPFGTAIPEIVTVAPASSSMKHCGSS